MRVHRLDVTQVLIYPRDRIPFWELSSATALNAIQEHFAFEAVEYTPPGEGKGPVAMFQRGLADEPVGTGIEPTPIQYLAIGDGRIEASTYGDDDVLDQFVNAFGEFCTN